MSMTKPVLRNLYKNGDDGIIALLDVPASPRSPKGAVVIAFGAFGQPLEEIAVDRIDTYRDGGTQAFLTAKGSLLKPPASHAKPPEWNGTTLTEIGLDGLNFVLDDEVVISETLAPRP